MRSIVAMSFLSHLACGRCGEKHEAAQPQTTCVACQGPLLARYEIPDSSPTLEELLLRPPGQNRLWELAPFSGDPRLYSLGEGATPLIPAPKLGKELGCPGLLIKDESQNPTLSFKARGMAAALGRCAELGIRTIALPSAGNAGAAASAYGAHFGIEVHVAAPESTPAPILTEIVQMGGHLEVVPGTIADAARALAKQSEEQGWFPAATLKEPYRIEGKKVMGFELLYDLDHLPDVIVYPTGGGAGLIGMWKAFDEMEALGWIDQRRPKMVSVQTAACAPIVRAFREGAKTATPWENPELTAAFGLRVPAALGDFLILDALRRSGGEAVAVEEEELKDAAQIAARSFGLQVGPEGGACLAALQKLRKTGWLEGGEEIVVFNTGHDLVYRSQGS